MDPDVGGVCASCLQAVAQVASIDTFDEWTLSLQYLCLI